MATRLLVVEQNADRNRFVAQCLGRAYDVVSAFDAREGLQQALELHPSLLLVGEALSEPSAHWLLAELEKQPPLRGVPVLVLSAGGGPAAIEPLLQAGARDFVSDTFSECELTARVGTLLRAEDARVELGRLQEAVAGAALARDEFIAMLGHELRNPLSPILTALEVMKLRGGSGAELERSVIERQVSHLTRLIDDLLDVSRLARGKVELKMSRVELQHVIKSAIDLASPLFEQRSHALMVNVPSGLAVLGDALRLGQVVSNLLTNAAKYTPRGGDISIRAERIDDEIVLSVRDSGVGIAPETLPHVFDMFVQARQSIDRSQGGLGLGLTLVRNLVEGHRGSVTARSRGLGKGSEFVVRLPALAPEPEPMPAHDPHRREVVGKSGAPSRILVVDDNQDGADMLAEILAGKGYDTRVAHDAPSALRVAADFVPQVAFLDIGLPVMDGYELAGHLRNLPGLSDCQLIALTGYGQDSDRKRAFEAGFQHHLIKPVDISVIEATLLEQASS